MLSGGRTTPSVVRTGDVVRRPPGPNAAFVHELLQYLDASGFPSAPRFLGLDETGREMLSFLTGEVPSDLGPFAVEQFVAAARILRELHDLTARWDGRGAADIVCHGDPSPCNFVFRQGQPYALIDFDAAHPGRRAEDVGYAAWLWLDIGNPELDPISQGGRLAEFTRSYGALPLDAAVSSVLLAQAALAQSGAAEGTRTWAARCREWTERNRARLESSYEVTGRPRTA